MERKTDNPDLQHEADAFIERLEREGVRGRELAGYVREVRVLTETAETRGLAEAA